MSSSVIWKYLQTNAPTMSPPQSVLIFSVAATTANMDASMFSGITYMIMEVMGRMDKEIWSFPRAKMQICQWMLLIPKAKL